jgi:hypothetical protein
LGNLTQLTRLDLSANSLIGEIPTELRNLNSLIYLNLAHNNLSGKIPLVLTDITTFRTINLGFNQLSSTIPAELGNLPELAVLRVNNNQLTGDIPSTFINLSQLLDPGHAGDGGDGLDLDYNRLNVPPDYPDLSKPFHIFLFQKDPDWHLRQIILQYFFLPLVHH